MDKKFEQFKSMIAELEEFRRTVAEVNEKGIAMVEDFTSWFMGASAEEQKTAFAKLVKQIEEKSQDTVVNLSGTEIIIAEARLLMDEELREEVYAVSEYETEQQFFTAYELAHKRKYGELWCLSSSHPEY